MPFKNNFNNKFILAPFFTFLFVWAHGSVKESLIYIFSAGGKDCTKTLWYNASEKAITQSLCDVGVELFNSISLKKPFDYAVDHFNFIKRIQEMDDSIIIEKPVNFSTYIGNKKGCVTERPADLWQQWQEAASNPLSLNGQETIIKIRKFLYFFCDTPATISPDKIAEKLQFAHYIFFHDRYVKHALKVSLWNGPKDQSYKKYAHCIDPRFMILTFLKEDNDFHYDWWDDVLIPYDFYTFRISLGALLDHFSPKTDNSHLTQILYSKAFQKIPIAQKIESSINHVISCVTQIQKYIRRNRVIAKYNKKQSCRVLQSSIRTFNTQFLLTKLRNEKRFKVDPLLVTIPILPSDVWPKIISFSIQSLRSLIFVNTRLRNFVINVIDSIKKSVAENSHDNQFIQEIQALDASIAFYSRSYQELVMPTVSKKKNKAKKCENNLLNTIDIPLNFENREKIKGIRQCISAINTTKKPSDTIAAQLNLKNYCFFFDQYFSYALKILGYNKLLNTREYCIKYLECLDENFYIEIKDHFISEYTGDVQSNTLPNYVNSGYDLKSPLETYSVNMTNVLRTKSQILSNKGQTIRMRLSNFLIFLKDVRKCAVSNSIISYFNNPTGLRKKILLNEHVLVNAQSLIRTYNKHKLLHELQCERAHFIAAATIQAQIKTYNCQNLLAQLQKEALIIKAQSLIRTYYAVHQLQYNKALAAAAATIQAHIRRFLAQQKFKADRYEREKELRQNSITIQEGKALEREKICAERLNSYLLLEDKKTNEFKTTFGNFKTEVTKIKTEIESLSKNEFITNPNYISLEKPKTNISSIYRQIAGIIFCMSVISLMWMYKLAHAAQPL